jgi:phosphoglycerate-specific signal transduction histidine kinase
MKMEARHIAIFFVCFKLGDNATITHGKLQQAFGDEAMSRAQAFRWHMFSERRNVDEDEQRSGRPSPTRTCDNTARVRKLVRSDRRFNRQNDC